MNYLTKEQLDELVKIIEERPTLDLLEEFINKYRKTSSVSDSTEVKTEKIPAFNLQTPSINENNISKVEEPQSIVADNNLNNNIPSNGNNNMINNVEAPASMPWKQSVNTPNQAPINFSGNIFNPINPEPQNLMQPTPNFDLGINNTAPNNTNVNATTPKFQMPFFAGQSQGPTQSAPNPIPVEASPSVQPEPTMFGQMQQGQNLNQNMGFSNFR